MICSAEGLSRCPGEDAVMYVYRSMSEAETDDLARRLVRVLPRGTVLALTGMLGAGKTRFVRGLVKALGGDPARVSSPTFVLMHVYPTPSGRVYHLDAYRVRSAADVETVGLEDVLAESADESSDAAGWVCVEWPERVAGVLPGPPRRVDVELRHMRSARSDGPGESRLDDGGEPSDAGEPAASSEDIGREFVFPFALPD